MKVPENLYLLHFCCCDKTLWPRQLTKEFIEVGKHGSRSRKLRSCLTWFTLNMKEREWASTRRSVWSPEVAISCILEFLHFVFLRWGLLVCCWTSSPESDELVTEFWGALGISLPASLCAPISASHSAWLLLGYLGSKCRSSSLHSRHFTFWAFFSPVK